MDEQRHGLELAVREQPRGLVRGLGQVGRLRGAPQVETCGGGAQLEQRNEPLLAGRACDREPAVEVHHRVLVAAEAVLAVPEEEDRIEPAVELLVAQVVDERGRLRAERLRGREAAGVVLGQRQDGERGRVEHVAAERPAGFEGGLGGGVHGLVVALVEADEGELEQELARLPVGTLGEVVECVGDQRARIVMAAEQVLDPGAIDHEAGVQRRLDRPGQGERLVQGGPALVEPARGCERAGHSREDLDAPRALLPCWQQPQGRFEPVRGRRGCARRRLAAGVEEQLDRVLVADRGRPLDVTGARRRRRAPVCERDRRPAVRAQPPARRRGPVRDPPDEWVAEPEAPGRVGRAQDVAGDELVERREHGVLSELGDLGDELQLERVPRDRRRLCHLAGLRRDALQLREQGSPYRHRQLPVVDEGRCARPRPHGPRKGEEIERVAATRRVERAALAAGNRVAEERSGFAGGQLPELDALRDEVGEARENAASTPAGACR